MYLKSASGTPAKVGDRCLAPAPFGPSVLVWQTIQLMRPATAEFEKLLNDGWLRHGGHPVLSWMAGNCVVRQDQNENIMPSKKCSTARIEGNTAIIIDLSRAMTEPRRRSVYETNGGEWKIARDGLIGPHIGRTCGIVCRSETGGRAATPPGGVAELHPPAVSGASKSRGRLSGFLRCRVVFGRPPAPIRITRRQVHRKTSLPSP